MRLSTILLTMSSATVMAVMAYGTGVYGACPNVGADLAGCQILISVEEVNISGVATSWYISQNTTNDGPYDSSDDTLVGIQNVTSQLLTSITLTGTLGSNLSGFEADGACSGSGSSDLFSPAPTLAQCGLSAYTATDPQDYEAVGVTFTNYSTVSSNGTHDNVTVNVNLAGGNCNSAWFSLEEALTPGSIGGGTSSGTTCNSNPVGGTPEPGSLDLLGSGLGGLAFFLARKRRHRRVKVSGGGHKILATQSSPPTL